VERRMSQVEIPYVELEQEFLKELANLGTEGRGSERGILATSQDDNVTARRIRLFSDGMTLYGYTFQYMRKAKQIIANPRVSVVVDFIQIDGIASLKGHIMDEPQFLELVRQKQPDSYEYLVNYWSSPKASELVVIEIIPKRIALWKIGDPEAGIQEGVYVLNFPNKKAHRIDFSSTHKGKSDAPAYWSEK
jgi:general stress protein 26